MRWRGITVAAAFSLIVASFALVPSLGIIFAPPQPQEGVNLDLELRPGTELAETDRVVNTVARQMREQFPTLETVVAEAGAEGGFGPFGGTAENTATIDITLPPLRQREITAQEVEAYARELVSQRRDAPLSISQAGPQLGAANPIDILIQSEDLDAVSRGATDVRNLLRESFPEITEPSLDVGAPSPRLSVRVDQDRAADLGVSPAAAVREVRAAFAGTTPAGTPGREPSGMSLFVYRRPSDLPSGTSNLSSSSPKAATRFFSPTSRRSASTRHRPRSTGRTRCAPST